MMLPHYHWEVMAGMRNPSHPDVFMDAVIVTLFAKDEVGALKKARQLVVRPDYQVRATRECFAPCEPAAIEQMKGYLKPKDSWEPGD